MMAIGKKLGSKRQAILLAGLAILLLLFIVKWRPGASAPAAAPPSRPGPAAPGKTDAGEDAAPARGRSTAPREVKVEDVPLLEPQDFSAAPARGGADPGRDLFGLAGPTRLPVPTPTPAPPAPGDVRFVGPLPPPPPTPTPKPPDISFKFIGTFGPKDHPIAVIQQGDQVLNVRTGDTLFGKFILRKVGYESIDVSFVGFPDAESKRVGITP